MAWVKTESGEWQRSIKGVVTHEARQISHNTTGVQDNLWKLVDLRTWRVTEHYDLAECKKAAART